jgi:hypothetical protein
LAKRLGLSDAQKKQLVDLMVQRAQAFASQQAAAESSFRGRVESLLNAAQRAKVDWANDDRWTTVGRWATAIKDLTAEQTAELKQLVKARGDATWAALLNAQNRYTEGLRSILTDAQQEKFAQIENADSVIRIPMIRK